MLAGRQPGLQIDVDATAMVQAGLGSGYAQQIVTTEIADFLSNSEGVPLSTVNLAVRIAFNPNITTAWFTSVMGIINSITMLAIILAGAAIVREREHGTMDHLLVMPLTPFEIAMSKVWANGLVITIAVGLSLYVVVRAFLKIPIAGSIPLFMVGVVLYLFFATAIGIFLGTVARSMPQLGLLFMLVYLPMNMLSGSNTPLESMPPWLATIDAGLAVDAFRLVRAVDPLSRRRPRRRLEGVPGGHADRRIVLHARDHAIPVGGVAVELTPPAAGLGEAGLCAKIPGRESAAAGLGEAGYISELGPVVRGGDGRTVDDAFGWSRARGPGGGPERVRRGLLQLAPQRVLARVGADMELRDEVGELRGFAAERLRGRRRLLDHGRIFLRDLIHLVDRAIDLAEPVRLLLRAGGDLVDDLVDARDLGDDALERIAGIRDEFHAGFDLGGRGRNEALDFLAASAERSASARTSEATTAKPRPESPARAASTPALSASRLVWKAISSITPMIWLICSDDFEMPSIASTARRTICELAFASRSAAATTRVHGSRPRRISSSSR